MEVIHNLQRFRKSKNKNRKHATHNASLYAATFEVMGLVMLATCFVTASSSTMAADTTSTTASVTVSTSCQMSSVVDTAHTATVPGGTYQSNIGKTTLTSICNDANGYAIYAIGYTNTEFGRNDMLGSSTGRTIATGTATSGTTSNWAMKLTPVSGDYAPTIESDTEGSFASYHSVPDEYTKVASYANNTDDVVGSKLETTYAVFVASGQDPDTYTGQVKYTLVHPSDTTNKPCTGTYTIAYSANTGSGGMDSQTACVDTPIALLPNGFTAPTPTSENQFTVWNTAADGSGSTYIPGQSVANLASAGGVATLYAQWAPKYIQDLNPTMCEIAASESAYTVYDRRDGNDYTVRYINGACWMTQNLRITGTVNQNYSNFDRAENFNVCVSDLTAGNSYDEARCHDSGNTTNGVWYNYAAATAGQITGSSNNTVATQDICPENWSLPSYDTSSAAGSIQSVTGYALAFAPVTGGYYYSGSLYNTGIGYWWSTAASNNSYRYSLYSNGSSLSTSSNFRTDGNYIRCTRTS